MLFSVITVCLNSVSVIGQTLDSVLQQSFKDYELIVIDGGSTDGTLSIIKDYEPKFEGRMHWISEPDQGVYFAMNKGITKAHGEYLNFLNTGDLYQNDTFDFVANSINAYGEKDVFYGFTRYFDDKGEFRIERWHHTRLLSGPINHQAIWYKKDVFDRFGMYCTAFRIVADHDHLLTLFENKCSFVPVNGIVANYRLGGIAQQAEQSGYLQQERIQMYTKHGYRISFGEKK